MRKSLLLLTGMLLPLAVNAAVSVEWISPDTFKDAYATSSKTEKSRQAALDDFQKFIIKEASPRIAETDTLKISVTELDMTGEFEPWDVNFQNVRKMKSPYFGHISLKYSLTDEKGNVIKEGDASLTNQMLTPIDLRDKDEMDPYLRSSLRDWIITTFPKSKSCDATK